MLQYIGKNVFCPIWLYKELTILRGTFFTINSVVYYLVLNLKGFIEIKKQAFVCMCVCVFNPNSVDSWSSL